MAFIIPEENRPGPAPAKRPEGALSVQWLGTASFRLIYKGRVLLIDPHVTRPGIWRTALLKLYPNETLCEEHFPKARDILIGHSHCDHLLDAPTVAKKTGATIHGSASTALVCRAAGLPPAKNHSVETWKPVDCGAFRATFVPSLHGKALFGRVPFPGSIDSEPTLPMRAKYYKHGDTYGLLIETGKLRLFHIGSADLIDEEIDKVGRVDVLLLGLAGRKKTENYLPRLLGRLHPKYVVAMHFDNFFSPLARGLKILPGIGMDKFLEEYKTAGSDAKLLFPNLLDTLIFNADSGKLLNG